jgi:hypothetical protein
MAGCLREGPINERLWPDIRGNNTTYVSRRLLYPSVGGRPVTRLTYVPTPTRQEMYPSRLQTVEHTDYCFKRENVLAGEIFGSRQPGARACLQGWQSAIPRTAK